SQQQAIRVAELQKEQAIGEQTAGFQREAHVRDAEREMRIKLALANALAITGENESQAKIAASQAELLVKKSDAYTLGETRKREAEAAVLGAQTREMGGAA